MIPFGKGHEWNGRLVMEIRAGGQLGLFLSVGREGVSNVYQC